MQRQHPIIKEGDLVIVCSGYGFLRPAIMKPGQEVHVRDVPVPHDLLIGRPFGAKVATPPRGARRSVIVHALRPTPELWSLALPHRTQIIFAPDIATILLELDVRPGSVVLEAGTGSGSLTHSFARAVYPNGTVHTVEYHAARQVQAAEEFLRHGIDGVVKSRVGDIYDPATLADLGDGTVDAMFLDVPKPWDFFTAKQDRVIRGGGMFCGFSPCIEQTHRTIEAMKERGCYVDVRTVEVVVRYYDVLHGQPGKIKRTRDDVDGEENAETSPVPISGPVVGAVSQNGRSVDFVKPKDGGLGHSAFLTFARKLILEAVTA